MFANYIKNKLENKLKLCLLMILDRILIGHLLIGWLKIIREKLSYFEIIFQFISLNIQTFKETLNL